jgi:hypothetical protein
MEGIGLRFTQINPTHTARQNGFRVRLVRRILALVTRIFRTGTRFRAPSEGVTKLLAESNVGSVLPTVARPLGRSAN